LAQIHLVVFKKNAPLIPKNDVIEPKLGYLTVNWLLQYSLDFVHVTSFFGIKKNDKTKNLRQIFFQGLGENNSSLQPALKALHSAFKVRCCQ